MIFRQGCAILEKPFGANSLTRRQTAGIHSGRHRVFGESSPDADAEVIAVTIKSLLAAGLTDFQIDIGQTAFLKASQPKRRWMKKR